MKKLVFAAFAALAIVSVSNAFAGNKVMNNTTAEPIDTVAPTTPDTVETEPTVVDTTTAVAE